MVSPEEPSLPSPSTTQKLESFRKAIHFIASTQWGGDLPFFIKCKKASRQTLGLPSHVFYKYYECLTEVLLS